MLPDLDNAGRDLGVAAMASGAGAALAPLLASSIVAISGGYALIWPVAAGLAAVAGIVVLRVRGAR
ncbi:hypothetical protein B0I29_12842 [Actinoplanes lutulentus]|uniref:MFS transporter n=1 Tax=Actinoplanes lutulentus TaxID=1287878 RepID=A0A327YXA4_9ACTN|nr:hypothetical protein B0I29_12842 [Actinoplanes lutulentus]